MRRFVRQRLITALLIVWLTVTLAFLGLRLIPGDALINQMLQGGASDAAIAQQRAEQGLDQPVINQYISYLAGLVRGDLGYSSLTHQPVTIIIRQQLGATVALAGSSMIIAMIVGLSLGALEALYGSRWLGRLAGWCSIAALSSPIYWTGTLAIYVFSTRLRLLPATGSSDLQHLILPAGVLGVHVAGGIARITRTSLVKTLEEDFIRTAQAKGLPPFQVFVRHVLRVGLPAIISVAALQLGFVLGGTVITEMLFARQGIGRLLQNAVLNQDYPIVQGIVVLSAVIYSALSAAADLLYGLLDPRVRIVEEG